MNNVVLMGRLTADPELKNTNTGKEVTNFSIAVDRPYQKGEDRPADFIDIVTWGKTAVFVCQYFHKGKPIAVTGRLQTRTYEAKDGSKRKMTEVLANNVEFVVGDKSDSNSDTSTYYAPQANAPTAAPSPMDELNELSRLPDGDLDF